MRHSWEPERLVEGVLLSFLRFPRKLNLLPQPVHTLEAGH